MRILQVAGALLFLSGSVPDKTDYPSFFSIALPDGSTAPGKASQIVVAPQLGTDVSSTRLEAWMFAAQPGNVFNVQDFGAKNDGKTPATSAINAAVAAASTSCGKVFLPSGTYYVPLASGGLIAKSCITFEGAGKNRTIIQFDDTGSNSNYSGFDGSNINHFTLRDLTLAGKALSQPTTGVAAHNFSLSYCSDILIENVRTIYSRDMGMVLNQCQRVKVLGVSIAYTQADGMSFQDTSDLTISGFDIFGANDDAISCHTNDTTTGALRGGIEIGPGTITESQGIACLGAKRLDIHNVIMQRMMSYGIDLQSSSDFDQGHTSGVAVSVHDNIISDVFSRQETPARNGMAACILVGGDPAFAGQGPAPPGRAAGGSVVDLFGSGIGNFNSNATNLGKVASPGGYYWSITGNQCIRTKPAVAAFAAWGSGSRLWVGNNGATPPWYSGPISETGLQPASCIGIAGALRYSLIANNICATSGINGLLFPARSLNGDFDGLVIANNIIMDYSAYGIRWPAGTSDTVTVTGNMFDADPRFVSPARNANGTWAPSGGPIGVSAPGKNGLVLQLNQFRNMQAPVDAGAGYYVALLNTVYGALNASPGYNAGNTGVGSPPPQGFGWLRVPTDGNPASSTFGQMTANPDYSKAVVLPTPLVVSRIANPGSISAVSVTTPVNNLVSFWNGTSLGGALPTYNLVASDGNGGGGTVALTSIVLYGSPTLSGGAGCSVNDQFYISDPQPGGNLVGGGQAIITLNTVSGGVPSATGFGLSASSGNVYLWAKPLSASSLLTAKSSTCTTLPMLVSANASWAPSNAGGELKAGLSLTTPGAGYTAQPLPVAVPGYAYTAPAGSDISAQIASRMAIGAGIGKLVFDDVGTNLGEAGVTGSPVLMQGASIDATGQNAALTSSGYTVPPNTSLVRLKPTTAVVTTVTLSPALGDGQAIQFVNPTAFAITLTFSPSVVGWNNGAILAATTGLRVRWDATASAWQREQ